MGPGFFDPAGFALHNGESVHFYGPCRASGMPVIAGLIMHHEIEAGWIPHKLAFGCECPAFQEFIYPPAIWTDGWLPGGIPEGALLQLDPALDLARFALSPAARTVARALQEYGAVLADFAGGVTLYGESLEHHAEKSWRGRLAEDALQAIGFEHYRILATGPSRHGGCHPRHHGIMKHKFAALGPAEFGQFQKSR